jgi:hypothetical protein
LGYSLEDRGQFCNRSRGQERRSGTWLTGETGAAHRDVRELIGKNLDLAMPDLPW